MKVIHLTFSAGGGAGVAAARSVRALRERGVAAELWTADGSGADRRLYSPWWLWLKVRLDSLPQRLNRKARLFSSWSNNALPSRLAKLVNRAAPDVVHLHWVGAGFLNLSELARFKAPVVWTLHDTWAFTGGCHYPGNCERLVRGCGSCPQLASGVDVDASRRNRRRFSRCLPGVAGWIAPSGWMAGLATSLGGLPADRMHVVPNGLDVSGYRREGDRAAVRRELGLAPDSLVVVAGAHDLREPRKGGRLLPEAMATITRSVAGPVVLLLFGEGALDGGDGWPCEVRYTGYLRGESELARVFHAADLLMMPSLQDNLPNTAVEALACGCPVVGFDRGGLREIVEHGRAGWLTDDATGEGLGRSVLNWLASAPDPDAVATAGAEQVARKFNLEAHGCRLHEIYTSLLRDRESTP